jgi:tRNA-2-methylthio-N6-dimethylallyladenosine synthase
MTYFFETYGCQMNIAESAAAEQQFIARGWKKADSAQTADVAVINTCSVRETAENRILGRLGWYAGLKALRAGDPNAKSKSLPEAAAYVRDEPKPLTVVLMGCMAERLRDTIRNDYPVIDYVVGSFAKQHFTTIIDTVEQGSAPVAVTEDPVYTFAPVSLEPGAFTSFVPIMNGCNNFCTYCIVPYVRGREVSRPVDEIFSELDVLSAKGVKEITLLGQNVNSYHGSETAGGTAAIDFPQLMRLLAAHLEKTASSIGWIRFESSHPKDLSDELIDVIAAEPRICHHIHLPVQHGSDRILKAMNRNYTREQYLSLVGRIRNRIHDVSLTTDIMLGFPGETEEDVDETLQLLRQVRFEDAFMYYYNPREGTPASRMDRQIPVELKKSRLQRIIDMQLSVTREERSRRTGQTVPVLAESVSRNNDDELLGKTARNESVAFKAPASVIGSFVTVRLDALNGNTFHGSLTGC